MNARKILVILLAALLSSAALAELRPEPPLVSHINHYVYELDMSAYITPEEIDCYHRLVDAVFAREEKVELTQSYDANLHILMALQNNPYHFLLKDVKFADHHTAVLLTYAFSREEQVEMVTFIDGEYLKMFQEILELDMTDLEMVLAVHHYFASRISYDFAYEEGLNLSDEKFLYPEIEIYEALRTGKGVCHSYTYLCEFALQQLRVECLRLTAEMADSDDGHMWLAVRLDGEWYHVDPTWDSEDGYVSLRCFGMTDEERVDAGIVNNWNVGVDMDFGPIRCTSERFADFRDIYDYRMLGGHRMEVWRIGEMEPEIIDLRKI